MNSYNRKRHSRIVWTFCLTVLFFICLIYRLVRLQACEHEHFFRKAVGQHIGEIQIRATRGSIFDRNGEALAVSIALPSIYSHPYMVKNPERTAFYLSLALDRDKNDILEILEGRSPFVWIARKIEPRTAEKIKRLNLEGIFIKEEATGKRFYPKKKVASHILGYTGIDDQGLEGVEANYENILSGKAGAIQARMDERGRILPGGHIKFIQPVAGKDIYLTIDETIQFIVERELENTVRKYNADGGTIIVYDPRSGDILAMANSPDYTPSDDSAPSKEVLRNRAVCDSYEPGSTFKTILAAAALDSGAVTTKDRFFSGKSLQVGGYSLKNADDGLSSPTGYEDIDGVITYSFNVGAASLGLRIGKDIFYGYIEKMGFGKLTGIDLSGEAEGIVPHVSDWKPINLATISYGQGIAVTPIQLVQAYGAIANEGIMMKPRVVTKIVDHDMNMENFIQPEEVALVFKPETCNEILKILANVCENGTAKNARIPGYTVGGKTGTANVVKNGVYVDNNYIASFVGIVPIEDPQIVMLIKIDRPEGIAWGGVVAAPVFKRIGSQILWRLGIKPNNDEKTMALISPGSEKKGEQEN